MKDLTEKTISEKSKPKEMKFLDMHCSKQKLKTHGYTVPGKANRPLLKVFQRLNRLNYTVKMISNLTWF